MRGVFKKFIKKDQYGRVLSINTEHLRDDGKGRISLTTNTRLIQCPGCRRHISDIGELRGHCHFCYSRTCCVHCESKCAVCSRRLCSVCRRGFTNGQSLITACPHCLAKLQARQAYQDRLVLNKIVFDRQVAINRERIRLLNNGLVIRLPGRRAIVSPRWFGIIQRLNTIRQLFGNRGRRHERHLR